MDIFFEILKLIIPAGIVFITTYFVMKGFFENDQNRRDHELKKANQSALSPLKLQAYERIVIFLERINPNTLLVRVNKSGMNAQQFHLELIKNIKSEYEHNLSQQIYISAGAWELVKNAKEEIIKLINITSTKIGHDQSSNELAMMILNVVAGLGKKLPNDIAIDYLKKEVTQTF